MAVKPEEEPEGPGAGDWGLRSLREEPYGALRSGLREAPGSRGA